MTGKLKIRIKFGKFLGPIDGAAAEVRIEQMYGKLFSLTHSRDEIYIFADNALSGRL